MADQLGPVAVPAVGAGAVADGFVGVGLAAVAAVDGAGAVVGFGTAVPVLGVVVTGFAGAVDVDEAAVVGFAGAAADGVDGAAAGVPVGLGGATAAFCASAALAGAGAAADGAFVPTFAAGTGVVAADTGSGVVAGVAPAFFAGAPVAVVPVFAMGFNNLTIVPSGF